MKTKSDMPSLIWRLVDGGCYRAQQFTGVQAPTYYVGGENMKPYAVLFETSIVPLRQNGVVTSYQPRVTITPGTWVGESVSHRTGGRRKALSAAKVEARKVLRQALRGFIGLTIDGVPNP